MKSIVVVLLSGLLGAGLSIQAQDNVLITEFMAANSSTIQDEEGQYSDWIELYNPGTSTVNLDRWCLTDAAGNLTKWRFPAVSLPPYSYLVVFASGNDRTNAAAPLHTNFKLDADGEYLALVKPDGVTVVSEYGPRFPAQEANVSYGLGMVPMPSSYLVPTGATAKVYVPTADIGLDWTGLDFDDSAWLSGPTGIGYDLGTNYGTVIGTDLQTQMLDVGSSAYIRLASEITDPTQLQELKLRMRYDDGFALYFNGTEVLRTNAPVDIRWDSTALVLHGSEAGMAGRVQADFDTVTNVYASSHFEGTTGTTTPAASIQAAGTGSTGRFLRLINDGVNYQGNAVAFQQTVTGSFPLIIGDFDFRITSPDDPAYGFAFMLVPTAVYGASGPGAFRAYAEVEEPNYTNVFAIGFDLYPHSSQNDVSAHWNGTEFQNVTIPRSTIEMVSGQFHHCQVRLEYAPEGAYVTVVITPNINMPPPGSPFTVINRLLIPGLPQYEARVEFAGRTGGLNMSVDLDNIDVQFRYPEGLVPAEEINLARYLPLLQAGSNVIAIHGLNVAATNGDFLILPELVARGISLQTTSQLYFTESTPGTVNAAGIAERVPAPQFSVPSGVYTNDLVVALSSSVPDVVIHYTLNGDQPTEASPIYTEPIGVSNSVLLMARAYAPAYLVSPPASHSYTLLASDLFSFSSDLPLIIVDAYGRTISQDMDPRVPGTMTVIDTRQPSGRATLLGPRNYQGRIGIEGRGQTSWGFAKKPYNVELRDDYDRDKDVSLLGMPAESDWVLFNPYNDKTFMNDFLAYELYEKMGNYSVRRHYCEVFFNGTRQDGSVDPSGKVAYNDYVGIYMLLERIKIGPDRVDIQTPETGRPGDPITGGYIWKKDKASPGDVVFTTPTQTSTDPGAESLKYHDPKAQDLTPVQQAWLPNHLTEFENVLTGANWRDPVDGYAKYIDIDSFVDYHWIVEFSKQIDGYRLSDFLHMDRGGKTKINPIWDWNLSFGNANYLQGGWTNGWYYSLISAAQHMYLRRLVGDGGSTAGDPDFVQKTIDRWGTLREGLFHPSNVLARVDQITNLLWEAQGRDFVRWPRLGTYLWPNPNGTGANGDGLVWHVDYQNPTTYAGIITQLKKWINGRYAWIDGLYLKAPYLSRDSGSPATPLGMWAPAGSTIYYTTDGSDPRMPGGFVSPTAQVYADPVNLPARARVFARVWQTNAWSPPARATFGFPTPQLAVSEIMYHPQRPPGSILYAADEFEFIELLNTGPSALDLAGFRFAEGINFIFPGGPLGPIGAETRNAFEGEGTTYTPTTLGAGPGAAVVTGGPSGSYLHLISQNTGTNRNRIAFDQTAAGSYDKLTAEFDFRGNNATPPPVAGTPTAQNFDDPGSSYVTVTTTGADGPAVLSGGPSGQFMRITPAVNSLANRVFFDRTAVGAYKIVIATFDFRIAGSADGMCFVLLNTASYGSTGAVTANFSEEPSIANALGVGFDIYLNTQSAAEPNANHVSLHWNGSQVTSNAAAPSLSLAAGRFHRAKITIKFETNPNRALVTVEIAPDVYGAGGTPEVLFDNFVINGVAAFEGRVALGARTGGANATHDFDNLNVQYFNEIPPEGGLAMVWLPTATFGAAGPGSTLTDYVDLPNLAGAFALNLNMHSASLINGATLHWNGAVKGSAFINPSVLNLDDGLFHRAHLEVLEESQGCLSAGAKVTLTITPDIYGTPGTPITVFSNLIVAGFSPADLRVEFAGRSGGMNLGIDLDNVNMQYERYAPNLLEANQRIVLAANRVAFESLYGPSAALVGEYTGRLDNNGERLALYGPWCEPILDFRYSDEWFLITDNVGFSLVMTDPTAPADAWNDPAYWSISTQAGGSPGQSDAPPPVFVPVVVNETLTHSDTSLVPGLQDAIELFNPSPNPANVGNWYLSDDFRTPKKYRFPADTTIPGGSYLVVYETQFNPNPADPTSFALSAVGDEVYLFSGDEAGNLTGYYHGFGFGPAEANVSFGRHVLSTGEEYFVAQAARTLGETNAGPLTGPIVISEVMYHPPDYPDGTDNQEDEYIELHNITDAVVALYDTAHPAHTWRLSDAVDYQFPQGTEIPAHGYLLVVSFDPLAEPVLLQSFRAKYGLSSAGVILGPYDGKLDNSSDPVELKKPGPPYPNTLEVDYILVDKVKYTDNPPFWPLAPDGMGQALHRIHVAEYGNDPINWAAGPPSPIGPYAAGLPPTIITQPASQTVLANTKATFSIKAGGVGPYRYQWRFNQMNLAGATNATLVLSGVQSSQAGEYRVVVLNSSGAVDSAPATLSVTETARIIEQPANLSLLEGASGTFRVEAVGNGPLHYQWRKDGRDILGANDATYPINNVRTEDEGVFSVVVSDPVGPAISAPATLRILTAPSFVRPPVPQTAVAGSTAILSVETRGSLPMGYRWRKNFSTLTNEVLNSHAAFLTLPNVQASDTANYSVVITNEVNYNPGVLSTAGRLTVVTETDGDGLPDAWETANGLDPNNPNDAAEDSDGDGMTNGEEYVAGTDPQDPTSYLRVDSIAVDGTVTIEFQAVSNKTYAVDYSDQLGAALWQRLVDVPAAVSNRTVLVTDPDPPETSTERFYRLATPRTQP
jgi:hypothetical protein